jgi:excisionase family DNA binding protein
VRKLLYAVNEAATATGIGRSKLYELMASGAIESVKVGKRRLIPAEALETFVAGLREEAVTDDAA